MKFDLINKGGTDGKITSSDGMVIHLKPPTIEESANHLTPMHLIGMAWSGCLNSTVASIFQANQINKESRVRVEVQSDRNREHGLHYRLTAYLAVEDYDETETLKVARHAHRLCPISKLIAENSFVSLAYESY